MKIDSTFWFIRSFDKLHFHAFSSFPLIYSSSSYHLSNINKNKEENEA